jgi:hypothetical protein
MNATEIEFNLLPNFFDLYEAFNWYGKKIAIPIKTQKAVPPPKSQEALRRNTV